MLHNQKSRIPHLLFRKSVMRNWEFFFIWPRAKEKRDFGIRDYKLEKNLLVH